MLKSCTGVRVFICELFNHQTINLKTMKMTQFFRTAFIALFVVAIYSCSDDDDTTFTPSDSETIAAFVAANPDYSSLLAALERADLVTTLSGQGSFTVFAPNNAAFAEFLDGDALTDVPVDVLRTILLNHVLSTEVTSDQINKIYTPNLANFSLLAEKSGDNVTINGEVSVTTADIDRSNGIIHAVDKVIDTPTLLTFVAADSELSSLAGVATDAVVASLNGDTELTLLAPNNAAFTALGDVSGLSEAQLQNILLNHVIAGTNLSGDLSTGYGNTLANYGDPADEINLSIYINTMDGVSFNGVSSVVTPDIVTRNGVIHIVDAVITLPDVTTFAIADAANFSTLATALTDAGLVAALQVENGTGTPEAPFTVFAPVNAAFTAIEPLPTGQALSDVLTYHVIAMNNVRSTDLANVAGSVATVNGESVTISADPASVTGNGNSSASEITVVDVQASNGIIHAINQVLLPTP